MMTQLTLHHFIPDTREPDIDYDIWNFPMGKGWDGWIVSIQPDWPFDDLVYIAIDDQGNLEDYMEASY